MNWTPFGSPPEEANALVDGIPQWMAPSLRSIFHDEFTVHEHGPMYLSEDIERMRHMELQARMRPLSEFLNRRTLKDVFGSLSDDECLRVLDWLVRDNTRSQKSNGHIGRVLYEGGSKWKVGLRNGEPGLQ